MRQSFFDKWASIKAEDLNRLSSGFGRTNGDRISKFYMMTRVFRTTRVENKWLLSGYIISVGTSAPSGVG